MKRLLVKDDPVIDVIVTSGIVLIVIVALGQWFGWLDLDRPQVLILIVIIAVVKLVNIVILHRLVVPKPKAVVVTAEPEGEDDGSDT